MRTPDTAAAALIHARATGTRADLAALPVPSFEEALAIQSLVQAHIGPVAGFKVAARPDCAPIIAPIPAARVYSSGAEIPMCDRLGIELEIGFEVIAGPGPDPMADPAFVFRPRLVIELVDTRIAGPDIPALLKLADMQINDGLVLGPAFEGWDGRDFGTVTAHLVAGRETILDGPATVPGGSALSSLALFCAHLGDHCGGLKKGHVVITGSLCGLAWFPPGTDIAGSVDGFGKIACQLTPRAMP